MFQMPSSLILLEVCLWNKSCRQKITTYETVNVGTRRIEESECNTANRKLSRNVVSLYVLHCSLVHPTLHTTSKFR